ncbi:MAG TPA: hypothetical protein VHH32_08925 [Gemmatimonadales bacterium]|nr:hypothetical protein [Gemmatimonadales bacterium]
MRSARTLIGSLLAVVALLSFDAGTVEAQGKAKHKHYIVSADKAVSITRTVLVQRGYTVVRIDRVGGTHVVYYRRGNMGRGKGKGPIQRMVIRTLRDRVVFEDAEPSVLVDIDVKLKL